MKKPSSSATALIPNGSKKPKPQPVVSKNDLTKAGKRKDAALYRVGVSKDQIAQCPRLAPFFGKAANIEHVLNALRFSADVVAIKFLAVYDKIPLGDRRNLNNLLLETVAVKSGVDFNEILGAMMFSLRTMQAQKSGVITMLEHPSLVRSTIKFAHRKDGVQDRRMLHEAVGFTPTPKGMTMNFNMPQAEAPKVVTEDTSPDVNDVFPMISEKEQHWQDRRTKLLEAKT